MIIHLFLVAALSTTVPLIGQELLVTSNVSKSYCVASKVSGTGEPGLYESYLAKKNRDGSFGLLLKLSPERYDIEQKDRIYVIGERIVVSMKLSSGPIFSEFITIRNHKATVELNGDSYRGANYPTVIGKYIVGIVRKDSGDGINFDNAMYFYGKGGFKIARLPDMSASYYLDKVSSNALAITRVDAMTGKQYRTICKFPIFEKNDNWLIGKK